MSAYRIAERQSLRSLHASQLAISSRCRATPAQLAPPVAAYGRLHLRRAIAARDIERSQSRWQSTSSESQPAGNRRPGPPPPPRPTLRQIISAVLGGGFRNLRGALRGQSLRTLFRQNPEELVLALICLAVAAGAVVYAIRLYYTYFYHEQFTRYPAPVAKSLRRALYYSNYSPDPPRALKYYRQALQQCEELGLDPFSDDVMGIKIQLAAWLEKIENFENATKVLEALLKDCKRWVEVMEKSVKDGTAPKLVAPAPPHDVYPQVVGRPDENAPPPETLWGKRTRVLGKAIGISVKLGELYSDEHLLENERAHERLIWAVETALGESRRRATEGLKEGEGDWMSSEAIGGALESLGHSYESRSQFHLAVPLFLQALRLCQDPCHSSVIMNNLAASFAQHPTNAPHPALDAVVLGQETSSPKEAPSPANTRAAYLDTARRWATNAHLHATDTQGEQRTPECDEACAVSLCTLGDIEALAGDVTEARKRFQQCIGMSKQLGYSPGIAQAEEGLRRLKQPSAKSE